MDSLVLNSRSSGQNLTSVTSRLRSKVSTHSIQNIGSLAVVLSMLECQRESLTVSIPSCD
jgi:hypothetical protein